MSDLKFFYTLQLIDSLTFLSTHFLNLETKDNIYIDMQAGRNLLPKLLVADN